MDVLFMKRGCLAILLAGLACAPGAAQRSHPLEGRWEGWIDREGAKLSTVIDISEAGGTLRGEVTYSDGLSLRTRLTRIRLSGSRVSWNASGMGGSAQFAGRLRKDTLRGPVTIGDAQAELWLARTGAVPEPAWTPETVRFQGANDGVSIAGTLLLPSGEGPYPAILLLNGSGNAPRATLWPFAEAFARNGIAALIYDKRGTGESSGDWQAGPFLALAGDAVRALRLLRERRDIDPARIGLWGASEGAYLAPAVMKEDRRIAFLVLMSTAVVTPAEQDLQRIRREMQSVGYGEGEIRDAVRLRRAAYEYLRTGRGRDSVAALRERMRGRTWMRHSGFRLGAPDGDPWWGWARTKMDYDPVPLLEQVRVPVLALYGGADLVVEPDQNATLLQAALRRAANRDVTVRIFPGADHSLVLPAGVRPDTNGRWDFHRAGPGAVDTMVAWLRARALASGS
jgi:alpha-beta hydrolase superfamily lysophospholipase